MQERNGSNGKNDFRWMILLALILCGLFFLSPRQAAADEEPLRFIQILRENGYGDMAVEYLLILDKRPDLPKEVRDVWDLEMSRSLRAAAADAYDVREYERLTARSQKHLEKFIKEHPGHPAVASAMISWGGYIGQRALEKLGSAKRAAGKNKDKHDKLLAEAREELKQSREKFAQAQVQLEKQLAALPPAPKRKTRASSRNSNERRRDELEYELLDVRFQTALVDYYLAQSYPNQNDKERLETLSRAAKGFDAIFQQDRTDGQLTLIGLRAHLWHGKTAEEMGDPRLATDIYDEVLVNAADPNERRAATGLEPLFAQVEYFRLLILAKQKPNEFLAEATAWLEANVRRLRQTEGYQGVALEVAKLIYENAQKESGPKKAKGLSESLRMLTDMAKVRSPYQQDAMLLRRELLLASGKTELEIGSFEEAVAMADAAVGESQWGASPKTLRKGDRTGRRDEGQGRCPCRGGRRGPGGHGIHARPRTVQQRQAQGVH